MAYHPDDSGMTWRENAQNGGGNGGGNNMSAFMPGQLNAIANQLQAGFGGGAGRWKKNLRQPYSPTPVFTLGKGGGNGNGGNGGGRGPVPDDPKTGYDPSRPHGRMAMPAPMQQQMMMQPPQMGLLSAQMPMQQQSMGLLGDIPPEVLAFIRGGR